MEIRKNLQPPTLAREKVETAELNKTIKKKQLPLVVDQQGFRLGRLIPDVIEALKEQGVEHSTSTFYKTFTSTVRQILHQTPQRLETIQTAKGGVTR